MNVAISSPPYTNAHHGLGMHDLPASPNIPPTLIVELLGYGATCSFISVQQAEWLSQQLHQWAQENSHGSSATTNS